MALWKPAPERFELYKNVVREAVSAAQASDSVDFLTFIGKSSIEDIAHAGATATRVLAGTLFMAPSVPAYATKLVSAAHLATPPGQYHVWIDRARTANASRPVGAVVALDDDDNGKLLSPIQFAAAVRLFTDKHADDALVVHQDLSAGGYLQAVAEYLDTEVRYPNGVIRTTCAPQETATGSTRLATTVAVFANAPGGARQLAEPQWNSISPHGLTAK